MTKKKSGRPPATEETLRVCIPLSKVSIVRLITRNTFPCLKKLKNAILEALK